VELGATLKAFPRLPGVGAPGFCPSFILPATPEFPSLCRRFQFPDLLPPRLALGDLIGIFF
jgi:hypothetical protein